MADSEKELREIAFRAQEISGTLIKLLGEIKQIREVLVASEGKVTSLTADAEKHIRALEKMNSQLAARIDSLEGR